MYYILIEVSQLLPDHDGEADAGDEGAEADQAGEGRQVGVGAGEAGLVSQVDVHIHDV